MCVTINRHTWKNNIKMDVRDIGLEDVDLMRLVQDSDQWRALVSTVMNLLIQ
jgi:hypothetical protein